jgi:hypothetical protein
MTKITHIITKYHSEGLSWSDTVDLCQTLLDTEMLRDYPEFDKLCKYYIAEGLCYYVPDICETK